MRNGGLVALALMGSLAVLWVMMLGAMVTYNAVAGDGMWDMMGDMGSMQGMMGRGGGPQTTGSASGSGDVTISDFRFQPTTMNVTIGTTIKWTNGDSAPHTATAKDGSFDTGRLDKGDSGEITFNTTGSFEYKCSFHTSMEGRVVVGASAP
jgi:plastocyanin